MSYYVNTKIPIVIYPTCLYFSSLLNALRFSYLDKALN